MDRSTHLVLRLCLLEPIFYFNRARHSLFQCYHRSMLTLFSDGSPLSVYLTRETARLRQPSHSNTPARVSLLPSTGSGIIPHEPFQLDHYHNRARERDDKCLVTGRRSATWSRLKAAHIFPHTHVDEVSSKQSYDRQHDLFPSSVG